MGWRGFTRQLVAAGRRAEREAAMSRQRSERDAQRRHKEMVRAKNDWAEIPVEFVITHVSINMLDKATGHHGPTAVLSVALSRSSAERLNFTNLDPSDALANFVHRMGFKKSTGFSPTKPIEPR